MHRVALAVLACLPSLSACGPTFQSRLFSFAETVTLGSTVQQRQTNCFDIPSSVDFPQTFGLGIVTTTVTTGSTDPVISVVVSNGSGADPSSGTWSNADIDESIPRRVTFAIGDGTIYTFSGRGSGQNCTF